MVRQQARNVALVIMLVCAACNEPRAGGLSSGSASIASGEIPASSAPSSEPSVIAAPPVESQAAPTASPSGTAPDPKKVAEIMENVGSLPLDGLNTIVTGKPDESTNEGRFQASMRFDAHACLKGAPEKELSKGLRGTIEAVLAADGAVSEVKTTGLPAWFTECFTKAIKKRKFDPPKSGDPKLLSKLQVSSQQ